MGRLGRWSVAIVAAGLYGISFALPIFEFFDQKLGYEAFVIGWRSLFDVPFDDGVYDWDNRMAAWSLPISWLANPATVLAICFAACGRWQVAGLASLVALGLAASILPAVFAAVAPFPGYWVWAGSSAFLCAACGYALRRQRLQRRAHVPSGRVSLTPGRDRP